MSLLPGKFTMLAKCSKHPGSDHPHYQAALSRVIAAVEHDALMAVRSIGAVISE